MTVEKRRGRAATMRLHFFTAALLPISPVLGDLLTYHPGWITRSVTTHDPTGENADGYRSVFPDEGEWRVLFRARGEGRITRIWMTSPRAELEKDGQEIWIELDGHTTYRGPLGDFFEGRGPWKSPLVLGVDASSGALTSYVPFAWSREAKVRFRGVPLYSQITYREGPGSIAGPTAEEFSVFMSEDWTATLPAPSPHDTLDSAHPITLGAGPVTISRLSVEFPAVQLKDLRVRIGDQAPVPASFFFGLASDGTGPDAGWVAMRSGLHAAWPPSSAGLGRLATRLPIPLGEGETLRLEAAPGATLKGISTTVDLAKARPGVELVAQYKDQNAPGRETTMAMFETNKPAQFIALIENIAGGRPGDRLYLEGDEMIRTDGMRMPVHHGTGAEDYFNGGFYFLGAHANPLTGQPRFIVRDPQNEWIRAKFEHSLYRLHVPDPIVSRSGMRFGFEAGPTGAYTPLRVRSLGLGYTFRDIRVLDERKVRLRGTHLAFSAVDAERSEQPRFFWVREGRAVTRIEVRCPSPDTRALLLVRRYSQSHAPQAARVRLDGRAVGEFHVSHANTARSIAEDALWIDLSSGECAAAEQPAIEIDATKSPLPFSESNYTLRFFTGPAAPELTQGAAVKIFDTSRLPEGPHYVNDHSIVPLADGRWLLTGIFRREPYKGEDERAFVLAASPEPSPARWYESPSPSFTFSPSRLALQAQNDEPWIWAPHLARDSDGSLVMMYHAGSRDHDRAAFRIARSQDGATFTRAGATLFEDICVARDPMLLRFADLWVAYYTRCESKKRRVSGVAYRTSVDLVHWSPPAMALTLGEDTKRHDSGHTESPFVFERKGWFYLTATSYPTDWAATFVYRSRSPFVFPPKPIARLRAHAAEWIAEGSDFDEGRLFFTHAGAGMGGVYLQELHGL
jgi:hypothetical protein